MGILWIIPAYAGSTARPVHGAARDRDHPRIRGEHLRRPSWMGGAVGSSPHTRGARAPPRRGRRPCGDHPRIRGEHYFDKPQTRNCFRIIPAYAGSTTGWLLVGGGAEDHPRIRGEHALRRFIDKGSQGSSPHTRGARSACRCQGIATGIIPAYAGSTCTCWRAPRRESDHPRIRGEHCLKSSRKGPSRARIIPAYAGSTSWRLTDAMVEGDHPRIRGEHVKLSYM